MSLLNSIRKMFGLDSDDQTQATTPQTQDLSGLKLSELREVAKSRGLKGYTKLRKADLLSLLNEAG
jgi:hypothetical protein